MTMEGGIRGEAVVVISNLIDDLWKLLPLINSEERKYLREKLERVIDELKILDER